MIRRPPRSTRTDTLFPYTTLFRSVLGAGSVIPGNGSCTLTVDVAAPDAGDYVNVIPAGALQTDQGSNARSEEHTSELQSLMRISSAVFCLQKKKQSILRLPIAQHQRIHTNKHTHTLCRPLLY